MRKLFIFCIFIISAFCLKAQEFTTAPRGYHQHDGFYLSMNAGPVFGKISDKLGTGFAPGNIDFSGNGGILDFKIGWAIQENLILHAALISNGMVGPNVETRDVYGNTNHVKQPDTFGIGEAMYGVGFTRYFMPSNVFVSGTFGVGGFSIVDEKDKSNSGNTDKGFSMQLKVGKEWWIAKNWGIGFGISYGKTNVTNEFNGMSEELSSNRLGILFNTTFN